MTAEQAEIRCHKHVVEVLAQRCDELINELQTAHDRLAASQKTVAALVERLAESETERFDR